MCWRGHGPEFMRPNGKQTCCRRCHMLRVRAYRSGYPSRKQPLYVLNSNLYSRIKRRMGWTDRTVAVFAGISRDTLYDYKRRKPIRATRVYAEKISQAMHCDFSQLWSEACQSIMCS
jgi:DNA-binding XRE family transcriptional regulator